MNIPITLSITVRVRVEKDEENSQDHEPLIEKIRTYQKKNSSIKKIDGRSTHGGRRKPIPLDELIIFTNLLRRGTRPINAVKILKTLGYKQRFNSAVFMKPIKVQKRKDIFWTEKDTKPNQLALDGKTAFDMSLTPDRDPAIYAGIPDRSSSDDKTIHSDIDHESIESLPDIL